MGMETWHKDQAISHIGEMHKEIENLRAENKALKSPFGKIRETTPLKSGSWYASNVESDSGWKKIEADYAEDVETARANDEINAENQRLVENLRKVIVETGFPESHSEWKRNKRVSVPSDWATGITVAVAHGTVTLERRMKEFRELRAKHLAKIEMQAEATRREREKEEQKRIADLAFVDICRSVGADPIHTSKDEVEAIIRRKCKYLNLAVAMMDTRNDWNYGCYRVESALNHFEAASPVDEAIFSDVMSQCEHFEDGRQFRDCEWGYDEVMKLADQGAVELWTRFLDVREVA